MLTVKKKLSMLLIWSPKSVKSDLAQKHTSIVQQVVIFSYL